MNKAILAHWRTLWRRPLLRVLALIYVGLLLLQFLSPVALVRLAPQLQSLGGNALNERTLAGLEKTVALPTAWATVFSQVNGVGGLLLMIVAASWVATSHSSGLVRGLLARDPRRWRLLLAQFATLALAAAGLVVISLPLGLLAALLSSAALGLGLPTNWGAPGAILQGCLLAWLGLLPYMLLALAAGTAGRNVAAALTATLGYWLLEISLGVVSLLQMLGALGDTIYSFSLAQSVGALTEQIRRSFGMEFGQVFGQFGASLPAAPRAWLQVGLYLVLFGAAALWQIQRRDVR